MDKTTVIPGETLADVSVRAYGRLDALPALAGANGLALTATVTAGQVLTLPVVSFPTPVQSKAPARKVATARTATVKAGQCLPDIAVQYCGSFAAVTDLAALNGLAITADLAAGQVLTLPVVADKRAEYLFRVGGYFPAAGQITQPGGIGIWGIEFDFIVQ